MDTMRAQGTASPQGLMRVVEQARAARGMSKAELSRRSKVRFETVRRLLTSKGANPTLGNVFDMLRPLGLELRVADRKGRSSAKPAMVDAAKVKAWLSHYGAPLYGSSAVTTSDIPAPEDVLAMGLSLAREDASVARALPVAFWRTHDRMDTAKLRRLARRHGQTNTLGFFLDLTGALANEQKFSREARRLRPAGRARKPTQFFKGHLNPYERKLAEIRTPDVARKWNFRMNMSLDSWQSMFNKATR